MAGTRRVKAWVEVGQDESGMQDGAHMRVDMGNLDTILERQVYLGGQFCGNGFIGC